MPTLVYLAFNAVMYLVFAVWCAVSPTATSQFVGLQAANNAGQSEWMAVYGGLQAGLGLYFGYGCFADPHRRSALWLATFLYGGIVLFRTIAVARLGFDTLGNARMFYSAELVLFLAALALTWRYEA